MVCIELDDIIYQPKLGPLLDIPDHVAPTYSTHWPLGVSYSFILFILEIDIMYFLGNYRRVNATEPINSSSPEQNGRQIADDIFRCIFLNKICCILIEISLKFILTGLIDNNPALV